MRAAFLHRLAQPHSFGVKSFIRSTVAKPPGECERGSVGNAQKPDSLDWGLLAGSVGPRVRLLRNALAARSIAVSAPYSLPTGSLTVLSLVAANPGSSQTALSNRAGLNKSALVGIIDQLEQHGLIARDRSKADRRRYGVTVTAEGKRVMQALFAAVDGEEQPIRDALGADMVPLLALLDRAIEALEE